MAGDKKCKGSSSASGYSRVWRVESLFVIRDFNHINVIIHELGDSRARDEIFKHMLLETRNVTGIPHASRDACVA